MTLRRTDSEAAARVLSPARARASWRLFGLDGGMHGTWEAYHDERPRRVVGELDKPPIGQNLPLLPLRITTSHLPPADGVESGAGGVGHRPGGTEQGRAVGGKQGGHFPAGRTFAPELRLDLARCLLLLGKNTELTLVEILLTNWQKYNRHLLGPCKIPAAI